MPIRRRVLLLAAAGLSLGATLAVQPPVPLDANDLLALIAGDMHPPPDARLDAPLSFDLETVSIDPPTPAASALERWLRGELARGWTVVGGLGPARRDGTREAWFSRRHAGIGIDWPLFGEARPAPCHDAEALGCFEARPLGGEARVVFGEGRPVVRVRPYAHLSVYAQGDGLAGRVAFVGMVRNGDLAKQAAFGGGAATLAAGFVEETLFRPDVDYDGDGRGDHWRAQGGATGRVSLLPK